MAHWEVFFLPLINELNVHILIHKPLRSKSSLESSFHFHSFNESVLRLLASQFNRIEKKFNIHHQRELCVLTDGLSCDIFFYLNAGMDESLTVRSITCLLRIYGVNFFFMPTLISANCSASLFHHNRKAIMEDPL